MSDWILPHLGQPLDKVRFGSQNVAPLFGIASASVPPSFIPTNHM